MATKRLLRKNWRPILLRSNNMLNRKTCRPHLRPHLITLLLPLLASGCAPYVWFKEGTSPAETQNLLSQCTAKARAEAARHPSALPLPPHVSIDSQGRPITTQTMRNDSERLLLEQELISTCMNATGHFLRLKDPP